MSEIVQINFGVSGTNIGQQYLDKLILDHHLKEEIDPKTYNVSFFQSEKQPIFRGLFLDLEQSNIDSILTSSSGKYLDPNSLLCSKLANANGTFHSGQNIFKNELQSQFTDLMRRHIEKCERFESFNYVHSIYDKSSGLSIAAQTLLNDDFHYETHTNNSIFPSGILSNTIEMYNSVFSIHSLIDGSTATIAYHYDALYKSVQKLYKEPNFQNCNEIIAETILQNNCAQRFPGFLNSNMEKYLTNLVPFHRLHFFVCSFSPLNSRLDLLQQVQNLQNLQISYYTFPKDQNDIYLTQAIILRSKDKYLEMNQLKFKQAKQIDWISDGYLHVNCKVENPLLGETLMCIGNLRYYGQTLKIIGERFSASFRRKAFLHYYTAEGVDEMEFTEAESNCNDLISEYQDYGDPGYDDEE